MEGKVMTNSTPKAVVNNGLKWLVTVSGVIFAAGVIATTVRVNSKNIESNCFRLTSIESQMNEVEKTVSRIDTRQLNMAEDVTIIKNKILRP